MLNKIDLATLLDLINHPGFIIFNNIINEKINAYELELKQKDVTKNRIEYNRYDIIREAIMSLEEIQNEPLFFLLSDSININEEQRGDIQKAIEDLSYKISKTKKSKKLDTIQNMAENASLSEGSSS